ncbi:uncharacterized protein NEMAJ01_0765 [Nematocida major]|uniref:uncharacterized protein n=1 Tax=Nematocida major TaxID=1912982 RepID=UPI0020081CFB|nr:uncharacterized protein NEMAJ01_0765 [Nematocida major]KAH9385869.1 hypothetical protein NEMAJ01_0765 [Nematocida major]
MLHLQRVLECVLKEADGEEYDRKYVYSRLDAIPWDERPKILEEICEVLKTCVLKSRLSLCEAYFHWKKATKSLESLFSALNIQPGRRRRVQNMPLRRAFRQGILGLASARRGEEVSKVVESVVSFIRGSEEAEKSVGKKTLGVQMRLLAGICEGARTEAEIVRVYAEAARAFVSRAENLKLHGEPRKKITEFLEEAPGVGRRPRGLSARMKAEIRRETSRIITGSSLVAWDEFLGLLAGGDVLAVSSVFSSGVARDGVSRGNLVGVFGEAVRRCAESGEGGPYEGLMRICRMPWPEKMKKTVRKIVKNQVKDLVRVKPVEYSGFLVRKMQSLMRDRDAHPKIRQERPFLRIIAEEASSTNYFENSLVFMLVNELLYGASLKRARNVFSAVRGTWKYPLRRRIEGLLNDFAEAEKVNGGKVSLIHANSFRWPSPLQRLDLDVPEIAKAKRKILSDRKRKKVKIEWMDSLSVVEIRINSGKAVLSLLQYWIIQKILENSEIELSEVESKMKMCWPHIRPLVDGGILAFSESTQKLTPGENFNRESEWENLLPEYDLSSREEAPSSARLLGNLALDSAISKSLKRNSPQYLSELLQEIAKTHKTTTEAVHKRLLSLVARGLILLEEFGASQVSYIP